MVYLLLSDRTLLKSPDGGGTWSSIEAPNWGKVLIADPGVPTTLYLGTMQEGVFKSTNGGGTWIPMNTGLGNLAVHTLAMSPHNPAQLCAGTDGGLFLSTDAGSSWSPMSPADLANHYIYALAWSETAPGLILAGTAGAGVLRSLDGGATGSICATGMLNSNVYALAIDPTNPSTIYAGTWGAGVFKSTNGGANWSPSNAGLSEYHMLSLAVDPNDPATVFAGTNAKGVFKSIDGGRTWTPAGAIFGDGWIKSIAVDPVTPGVVYACTTTTGVFKSYDGGATWQSLFSSGCLYHMVMDPLNHETLYAAGCSALLKSTDGGATWNLCTSGKTYAVACDPVTPNVFWVSMERGVYRSPDGGTSWSGGYACDQETALAIDPLHTSVLFAGGTYGGVCTTSDAGASWTHWSDGLPFFTINDFLVVPGTPPMILAATEGGGVYTRSMASDPCTVSCAATAPTSGTVGSGISFAGSLTPSSCSGLPAYDWDFGDGTSHSSVQNPTHTYATSGSFTWTLTASLDGATCTKTGSITLTAGCAIDCTASVPSSGPMSAAISFASTATLSGCAGLPTYDWDFGDGTAHSTLQSPTHTYSSAGTFAWILTVALGGSTCTKTGTITIVSGCTINCTATVPSSGAQGAAIAFASTAIPTACSGLPTFDWDFGDGTAHSSVQNPTHVYASAGSFTWTFAASVNGVTCSKTGVIVVTTPCTLACTTSVPSMGLVGTVIALASSVTPTGCTKQPTFDWDFGDGAPHSSLQSPTHVYAAPGPFTWVFTVTANGASCVKTGVLAITAGCAVECSATVRPQANSGVEVAFAGSASTAGCTGDPTYAWDFGDGTTGAATANASHVYALPGTYRWTFRVAAQSAECSKSGNITINSPPVIGLIKKATFPFRLIVTGSNLQYGIRVYIDGTEWTGVAWKSMTKIRLAGPIKKTVPKGSVKTFRFVNPDGGETSLTWGW